MQLAMHSANELIGSKDTFYLYKAFKDFYKTTIKYNYDDIMIVNENSN